MARDLPSTSVFKTDSNNNKEEEKGTQLSVVEGGQDQQTAQQETSATVEAPAKEEAQKTDKAKTDSKPKTQKKQNTPKQQEVTQYEEVPVYEGEVLDSSGRTLRDAIALSEQKFQELKSKPTMEETHIRRSYLIDRIIDAEFDKISKKRKRGWKTHAINEALVMYLDSLKK